MKRIVVALAVLGWVIAFAVPLALVSGLHTAWPGNWGSPATAAAGDQRLTEDEALHRAMAWAAGALKSTIGSAHSNVDGSSSEAVRVAGRPIELADMDLVDLRRVDGVTTAVVAIDVGVSLPEEKDIWVVSWERSGMANAATGRDDGTAYMVVVIEDRTEKVLASGSGVRQPELQARARGPFPAFEELFAAPAGGGASQR